MSTSMKWPLNASLVQRPSWKLSSTIICGLIGGCSKIMLECLTTLRCHNLSMLNKYVDERPPELPLITVSNHTSCLDDPMLWGMLHFWKNFLNNHKIRWTLGAQELLFYNRAMSFFFGRCRVIPVVRGDGVYQKGVDFAIEQLNQGQWVHVFPEGAVNATSTFKRLKWGVGRLIAESKVTPVVIPFWHLGMEDVLPEKRPYYPRIFKKVTVFIGEPMRFDDIIDEYRKRRKTAQETRKHVTDVIQHRFKELKKEAEVFHTKWR